MSQVTGNLIDGAIVTAAENGSFDVTDPADARTLVGAAPAMGAADVAAVMEAAARGAQTWRRTGHIARGEVLARAADMLRAERAELAALITSEMGKTLAEATVEVTKTADFFDYYAGVARLPFGQLLPDARPGTYARAIHEPLGVVVLITPWNDPLLTPARKLGPALVAGNAVVIKPASYSPLIVLRLADILSRAGLPAGVLGTVTGKASVVSEPMLSHAAVRAVSFTGSTHVGQQLQRELAGRPVRVQTEMGGKNAVAVLKDADVALAAEQIVAGAFAQAGQRCTATSRVIVESPVADALIDAIRERTRALVVGPGAAEGTTVSPVVSASAKQDILGHISGALEQGAELLEGGTDLPEGVDPNGAFVAPTVLRINTGQKLWREEVFGPVLGIVEVEDEAAAYRAVNDSDYALSAAVFTNDLGAAERFIAAAEAGQVSVNQPTSGWDVHHPFGGFGNSGSPFKEQGLDALQFYTRTKTVAVKGL